MPLESVRERVVNQFSEKYGDAPAVVVRAPGRVNLIGEHTDYNDGFVLPLAIDRGVWIALSLRADREVDVWSLDFSEAAHFSLDKLSHGGPKWSEYLKGVASVLQGAGHQLRGWQGVMASDVPIGAGLSSSAAVELATARGFAAISHVSWDPTAMARYAQEAENEWVGVNCGIMDQLISARARDGHALLIDCRTLDARTVPMPADAVVVIMDTATRRGLVDSAYNERRAQCEAAAIFFGVPALRDVTPEMFEARSQEMDPIAARRARHVITENARTLAAAQAMVSGDSVTLGSLMNLSHQSLRDDFEVSSPALDAIVDIARAEPGCYGARMTGAGFGGCAIALVDRARSDSFVASVRDAYEQQSGRAPEIFVSEASPGAAVVPANA
jgi:galactokinase